MISFAVLAFPTSVRRADSNQKFPVAQTGSEWTGITPYGLVHVTQVVVKWRALLAL
jgi:hypothetical protein